MIATFKRSWVLVALAATFFLFIVIRTAWLGDDAFITLRTVKQLLSGHGAVWNVGERVQAYTHPLWMLSLTAAISLTREYYYTSVILSVLLSLATILLLGFKLAKTTTGALLGILILTCSKAFTDYSTSGLENPLTHFLLVLFLILYFQDEWNLNTLFALSLVTALSLVNRMDTVLLLAPPLTYALWRKRSWRSLAVVLAGMAPFVLWDLFSLLYYGFLFPNTAYAKLNTDIDHLTLITQGFLFFLQSISVDPLTVIVIAVGIGLAFLNDRWQERWIGVGILLYLLYIVLIGGDFMSGRFLSAPLLVATVIIVRQPLPAPKNAVAIVLFAGVLLLGLLNPAESPLLSNASYDVGAIDNKGIADERGHYYHLYGLLAANRSNRLTEQGVVTGASEPLNFAHCGIGMRGFSASLYTHIVDFCGLADPLLARLPAAYNPDFRIGHPIRHIPDGYLASIRESRNHLTDAKSCSVL